MMLVSLILAASLASATPPNPDWNCADPMVQQEMNWCAYQDFLAADALLNAQWKRTAKVMKLRDENFESTWDNRQGYFATLLAAQRAWITFRDAHCRSEGYDARGGSLESLLVSSCKAHLTRIRTAQLEELARTY